MVAGTPIVESVFETLRNVHEAEVAVAETLHCLANGHCASIADILRNPVVCVLRKSEFFNQTEVFGLGFIDGLGLEDPGSTAFEGSVEVGDIDIDKKRSFDF